MTKFSERNTDRQVSSSVEVEKMKIERSEAEETHTVHREMIPKLRAVATLRSQSGKSGQNRGVGSHDAIKLLNDEYVELIKVTLPALTRLEYNRCVVEAR